MKPPGLELLLVFGPSLVTAYAKIRLAKPSGGTRI
jgi:hypothetical protein